MNLMKYKSYTAKVDYSQEDRLLVGEVCDIDALILFSAESIPELELEFQAAVDGYLADCAARNLSPERPCSGTFNVRVGGVLHKKALTISRDWGVTLNQVVCIALEQVVDRHSQTVPATQTRVMHQTVGFAGYDGMPALAGGNKVGATRVYN